MFEKIVKGKGNKFFSVKEDVIFSAQKELGIILPKELLEFYNDVGYGFLHSDKYNFNRIMSPKSICDFRFRKGQFNNDLEMEIYDTIERDRVVFFEISEGNYLSIGFAKNNNGVIFYGNKKIASSLREFLEKYQENESYFE